MQALKIDIVCCVAKNDYKQLANGEMKMGQRQ